MYYIQEDKVQKLWYSFRNSQGLVYTYLYCYRTLCSLSFYHTKDTSIYSCKYNNQMSSSDTSKYCCSNSSVEDTLSHTHS